MTAFLGVALFVAILAITIAAIRDDMQARREREIELAHRALIRYYTRRDR